MIITKQAIPRRTVLRGLGAAVGLPLLNGMVPAMTALAQTPAGRLRRFATVYVGNGAAVGYFTPEVQGPDYALTPILEPLAPLRDKVLVLTGIDNPPALALEGEPRGGHGRIPSAFMSGMHANPTVGADFRAGKTIDQMAADHLGQDTQLRTLELSVDSPEFGGTCDTGFACVYTNTLAWRGPTSPLPMQNNPRLVFERLFGEGGTTDPAVRLARWRQRASILDSVREKVAGVTRTIDSEDRATLDEYLESIRDVERRIQLAEEQSAREVPEVLQPAGVPDTFEGHAELMFDLQVLAFQADLTRVTTFMLARELSGRGYPEIGVSEGFHAVSHHGNNPEKIADQAKINTYHTTLVAYFLDRLQSIPEGDGTLLDSALVLFGSGMGNSNEHDPRNLPLVLAGGAGGRLTGGRHLRYPEGTRLTNLHMTLLAKLGVTVASVGDSTGHLDIDRQSLA